MFATWLSPFLRQALLYLSRLTSLNEEKRESSNRAALQGSSLLLSVAVCAELVSKLHNRRYRMSFIKQWM